MTDTSERIRDPSQISLFHDLPEVIGHNVGSGYDRVESDWYVEPVWLVAGLLEKVRFQGRIHDPSCGCGTIPRACIEHGLNATGSDLHDRGYGERRNFFDDRTVYPNIVSNPPFAIMREWIDHALVHASGKVCVITRLAFLESQIRKPWFEQAPLQHVIVSSRRASMPPGGSKTKAKGTKIPFCWLVFNHRWRGDPTTKWI